MGDVVTKQRSEESLVQRVLRALAVTRTPSDEVLHRNPTRQRIAAFISIPRNASQTVQAILDLGPNRDQEDTTSLVIHENHQRAAVLARKYDLAALFVFCFVRNPFDRCVSWYEYHRKAEPYRSLSFSAWVEAGLPHHFRMQNETDYVASGLTPLLQATFIDGCRPDFIGRFEAFSTEMAVVIGRLNDACARHGLEHRFRRVTVHKNRSRRRRNYEDYYTPGTKAVVARLLREDFERFGYPTS
jgi:hypothetical protein